MPKHSPFPERDLEARGLARPEASSGRISQGNFLPPAQRVSRAEGDMQGASRPAHAQPLTTLNGTVGQEVIDGVCVDKPHAPALCCHTVLRLLLLRPRYDLLQLHL